MLEISNLEVFLNNHKILDKISLSVQAGEIIGILGVNGAGKTTLFRTIFGFVKKYQGEILWKGQKVQKQFVEFLEAESYFYPYITGKEYLEIVTKKSYQLHHNEYFKIPLESLVENYSTGMKQKLALWAVLETPKPVILLDEPFNGIDFEGVEYLYSCLKELQKQRKAILLTSHIFETLTRVCSRILLLENGRISQTLFPNEYTNFLAIRSIYPVLKTFD